MHDPQDAHANRPQLRYQPRIGERSLMILHPDRAPQLWTEMARHTVRQRRNHCPPLPALSNVPGDNE
jgi:hypothetical protein